MREALLGNVQQNGEADLEMWINVSGILPKAATTTKIFYCAIVNSDPMYDVGVGVV